MNKNILFAVVLVFSGVMLSVNVCGYEIWGCMCCTSFGCTTDVVTPKCDEMPPLIPVPGCCCDMEEFADSGTEHGCGLVWPTQDIIGDDEYCEIVPIGNSLSWTVRCDLCSKGLCRSSCTEDYDCEGCGWGAEISGESCLTSCNIDGACTGGYQIMAALEQCPNTPFYKAKFGTDPNGFNCQVVADKGWDPFTGPITRVGKWDASNDKCIKCAANKTESVIYGSKWEIDAYLLADESNFLDGAGFSAGNGRCESGCGADSACDEILEGGMCTAGKLCESAGVGVVCTGAEPCTGCGCNAVLCGNGVWDFAKGEVCEFDADCLVGSCIAPGNPDECTCMACGNGIIDLGEDCDVGPPIVLGACVGPNPSGTLNKRCLKPAEPDPCKCQICGDGAITGFEECDGLVLGTCAACSADCVCTGGAAPFIPPACTGVLDSPVVIDWGDTVNSLGGNIEFIDVGVDASEVLLDVTSPGVTPSNAMSVYDFDDATKKQCLPAGVETYCVELLGPATGFGTSSSISVRVTCTPSAGGKNCNNGADDDFDGDIDCEDNDCTAPTCGSCKTAHCNPVTYAYQCITAGACSTPSECTTVAHPNPADWECVLSTCTCKPAIEFDCGNGIDDDSDGCTDGVDSDCGGVETNCFDAVDNNCDGETDCNDPDCAFTVIGCNDCQDLMCNPAGGVGTGGWYCQTKASANCSTNDECAATTNWCNLETCNCDFPPPFIAAEERIGESACKIIVLLQGIVAGIATLILVYSGLKWSGSGLESPAARTEAMDRVKAVFVGLIIIIIALQFTNYMFGNALGTVYC